MNDKFYVVNVADTNMVLGVQCLYFIVENSMNYKIPQISFKDDEGKRVVLKCMNTSPSQVIFSNSMRSNLRHGDIEWDVECHITSSKPKIRVFKHPKEIETLLHKYEKVFRDLRHGRPPERGVEHNIVLEEGTSPIHIPPYRHPKKFIDDIENTFQKMKEVMSSCPILALPDFF